MDGRENVDDEIDDVTCFLNTSFVKSELVEKDSNDFGYPSVNRPDMDEPNEFEMEPLGVLVQEECWNRRCDIEDHSSTCIIPHDLVYLLNPRNILLE